MLVYLFEHCIFAAMYSKQNRSESGAVHRHIKKAPAAFVAQFRDVDVEVAHFLNFFGFSRSAPSTSSGQAWAIG